MLLYDDIDYNLFVIWKIMSILKINTAHLFVPIIVKLNHRSCYEHADFINFY